MLTKNEAVTKSIKQWKWLKKNGGFKTDYFFHEEIDAEDEPLFTCYLCQYVSEQVDNEDIETKDCIKHCPLTHKMWGSKKGETDNKPCLSWGSVYSGWIGCTGDRKIRAEYVVDALNKYKHELESK